MRNRFGIVAVTVLSACALSIFAIAGCSGGASSSASSATAVSSASAASSATASSEAASSEAAASETASSAAAASESAASASAESASAQSETASDAAASGTSDEAPENSAASQQKAASAQGDQVFTGTVHVVSAKELLELQGSDLDASMFNETGKYAVLVLDQPTDVTGMVADGIGPTTRTAKVLGIGEFTDFDSFTVEYGNVDSWDQYEGQSVTISAKTDKIMFPTDVSLPINEPKVHECEIVS